MQTYVYVCVKRGNDSVTNQESKINDGKTYVALQGEGKAKLKSIFVVKVRWRHHFTTTMLRI